MNTSKEVLRIQAEEIASILKKTENGEVFSESRKHPSITFAVVLNDKILKIEMTWKIIRETSQTGIAEFILNHMNESQETVQ